MLISFALAIAALPQDIKAANLFSNAYKIPQDLFYLAEIPSGAMFCDRAEAKRQNKVFDKRFGKRFNRLIKFVSSHEDLGWSPGDVIVTPCFAPSREQAARMLDDFETKLSAYEDRYGLTANVR